MIDQQPNNKPISIAYISVAEEPTCSLAEVTQEFDQCQREWLESETCVSLSKLVSSMEFKTPVDKIVCFGLGPVRHLSSRSQRRSCWQHLAAKTMAETLATSSGDQVHCYCQDPVYNDIDKEILGGIGITTLNDPQGFLAITSRTLVFSVSPNVPVKQITCDVQWPSAMLWNTVEPENSYKPKWTRMEGHDGRNMGWMSYV